MLPQLCFTWAWGGLVKENALFTRKGTEFQQLRQRQTVPSGSSSPGVGWTSEQG